MKYNYKANSLIILLPFSSALSRHMELAVTALDHAALEECLALHGFSMTEVFSSVH